MQREKRRGGARTLAIALRFLIISAIMSFPPPPLNAGAGAAAPPAPMSDASLRVSDAGAGFYIWNS